MSEQGEASQLVFFAGPNGSGKNTLTRILKPPFDYINADDIEAAIGCSSLVAAQMAEAERKEHVKERRSFCFETVLSTDRNLILLQEAVKVGFTVRGIYVVTCDPNINVRRVRERVEHGGHDIPTAKIFKRYYRKQSDVAGSSAGLRRDLCVR